MPNKEKREKLKKLGLCPTHSDTPVILGQVRCQKCVDKRKAKENDRKKNGFCTQHGDTPAVLGKTKCKECLLRLRLWSLKSRGGLSETEIEKVKLAILTFKGRCEICGVKSDSTKWHLDHCHTTKKFRGILCELCNIMLGYARNSPRILESGSAYLRRK